MAGFYPRLSILPLAAATPAADDGYMPDTTAVNAPRRPLLSWIALAVVYMMWGLTYLAIRVGVGHLPPLVLAGTRYVVAGALLYPIALRAASRSRGPGEGRPRPAAKAWLAGAVVGILLLFAGNGGLTVGETMLPSGFAAVLVATVPLWIILFAWPVQHQRITWRSAAGLAVGLGGVAILVGNSMASGRISGVIIVIGGSAAWGFGSVLGQRLALPSHAMLAAAIEMLAGGVVLLAAAAGAGEFSHIQWSSVPATSWIALAYLIGPGSILAFTAYGYALSHLPVTTVSTYAYVNPVVAVLAGTLFLGEHLTWREGLGAALVVGSIVIILRRSRTASRPAHAASGLTPETEMLSRPTGEGPARGRQPEPTEKVAARVRYGIVYRDGAAVGPVAMPHSAGGARPGRHRSAPAAQRAGPGAQRGGRPRRGHRGLPGRRPSWAGSSDGHPGRRRHDLADESGRFGPPGARQRRAQAAGPVHRDPHGDGRRRRCRGQGGIARSRLACAGRRGEQLADVRGDIHGRHCACAGRAALPGGRRTARLGAYRVVPGRPGGPRRRGSGATSRACRLRPREPRPRYGGYRRASHDRAASWHAPQHQIHGTAISHATHCRTASGSPVPP